jgi:hypothetical protein
MAAPAVRELNSLINELGQAVKPKKALIDQSIVANDQAGRAQEEGLAATAQQAYGQIEQSAQDKGMFFSGFSPDERAKYNAGTYLPALAQLQATIAGTRAQLMGQKIDLDTDVFNKAFATREQDISYMRDWEKMDAQQQFEARQKELDRAFQAGESAKDRAAAAANAAASKSSPADVLDADRRAIASELSKVTGGDGFVSPGSYKTMKNQWTAAGYDGKTFDQYFASFRNTYAEDKKNGATRSAKDYGLTK